MFLPLVFIDKLFDQGLLDVIQQVITRFCDMAAYHLNSFDIVVGRSQGACKKTTRLV